VTVPEDTQTLRDALRFLCLDNLEAELEQVLTIPEDERGNVVEVLCSGVAALDRLADELERLQDAEKRLEWGRDWQYDKAVAWRNRCVAAEARLQVAEHALRETRGTVRGLVEWIDLLSRGMDVNEDWQAAMMAEAQAEIGALAAAAAPTGLSPLDTRGVLWVAAIDRLPISERTEWVERMFQQVENLNAERAVQGRPDGSLTSSGETAE
jgi:hypothetical protein